MKCQGERGCEEDPEGILDRSFSVSNYLGLVIVPGQQIQGLRTINLRIMCYKPASFLLKHKHLKALPIQHNPIWYTYRYIYIYIYIYVRNIYIWHQQEQEQYFANRHHHQILKGHSVAPIPTQGFSHGHLPKNGLKTCPVVKGEDLIRTSRLAIPRQIWILNGTFMISVPLHYWCWLNCCDIMSLVVKTL